MTKAMTEAMAMISDAFRPERKAHQTQINNACRVRELVTNHRYLFVDAVEKCETSVLQILDAFLFMAFENMALNAKHHTNIFHMSPQELLALEWVKRLTLQAVA